MRERVKATLTSLKLGEVSVVGAARDCVVCDCHSCPPHTQIVANHIGCNHSSTEELIRCMKGKSQDELVAATKQVNDCVNTCKQMYSEFTE